MFQVRIHGRGGQGVVTGAEMLSLAAFFEGRHAQAFPSFGSERTGAPVLPEIPVACSYGHGTVLPGTLSLTLVLNSLCSTRSSMTRSKSSALRRT